MPVRRSLIGLMRLSKSLRRLSGCVASIVRLQAPPILSGYCALALQPASVEVVGGDKCTPGNGSGSNAGIPNLDIAAAANVGRDTNLPCLCRKCRARG